MINKALPPNLEAVAEFALQILKTTGILDTASRKPDWDSFKEVNRLMETCEVPWTTISPLMRRFLFALSATAQPKRIVGAGTFAGFAFAWLVMGSAREGKASSLVEAVGLDIDAEATTLAKRNGALLKRGGKLRFEQMDAIAWLRANRDPISLLYIDIDSPVNRKGEYAEVLKAARMKLEPGALVVAHDPCVPIFSADFERFHDLIKVDSGLLGPQILPLDECGVSIARVLP